LGKKQYSQTCIKRTHLRQKPYTVKPVLRGHTWDKNHIQSNLYQEDTLGTKTIVKPVLRGHIWDKNHIQSNLYQEDTLRTKTI